MKLITVMLALLLATPVFAQFHDPRALEADPLSAQGPIAPRLTGLGELTVKVSTDNAESQYFFDQGLRLTYGFNHSEALRSFKEAARLDPDNAMAWWGQALVLGPNINLPMMPYVAEQTVAAVNRAVALRSGVTVKEVALIDALALRYSLTEDADQSALNQLYADAMTELAAKYPDDPDIATLTASALMNLSPWNYWAGDGLPYPRTVVVMEILQRTMANHPQHTGALHYYIHIVEAQQPRLAEAVADALSGSTPGAGHLLHMPSHIYMRVGRYADSYAVNTAASEADSTYIAQCRVQGLYPVAYYPHNMHFLVWSAQMMGRYEDALRAAREISGKIPDFIGDPTAQPTGAGSDAWLLFETFLSQPLFTMARFGDWDTVLEEPRPREAARFMTGIWHYARGLAYIHTGNERKAKKEAKALAAIRNELGIDEYPASLNGAGALLRIAAAILEGEIDAAEGDYDDAIASLSTAVRLQDGLFYMEPPDWFMPSRHYLGAALLDAGRADEAETVYWQDLRKNPNNGYSLFGLMQAQRVQGKDTVKTEALFEQAWVGADHALSSSRY